MIRINIPTPKNALSTIIRTFPFPGGEGLYERKDPWLGRSALTSLTLGTENMEVKLDECVITVSQEKNIVTTALQGRNGTIKEYISDGDYQINVKAAVQPEADGLFTPADLYPVTELEQVLELFRAAESVVVISDFLKLFGIESAVIRKYSFTQETHMNKQSFTLDMISDSPYEIKLKEDHVKA